MNWSRSTIWFAPATPLAAMCLHRERKIRLVVELGEVLYRDEVQTLARRNRRGARVWYRFPFMLPAKLRSM